VLDELVEYAEGYFRHEEEYMCAIGFAGYRAHCQRHRGFEERLAQVRWQHDKGLRGNLPEKLLSFLSDWLVRHIMTEDMNYRAHGGDRGE